MIKTGLIKLITSYQKFISPLLRNQCRFYPSCSHYAIQALEKEGLLKGLKLTVKRLLKCHPFHPGGIDQIGATKA